MEQHNEQAKSTVVLGCTFQQPAEGAVTAGAGQLI